MEDEDSPPPLLNKTVFRYYCDPKKIQNHLGFINDGQAGTIGCAVRTVVGRWLNVLNINEGVT